MHEDLAGAGVVGDPQTGLVLDHGLRRILRALHDLDQAPALGARQRPRLADDHGVADVGVVALVVRVQRARGAHDLLVAAVAPGDVDPHGDRLVGLVGDDDALARLLLAGAVLARRRRLGAAVLAPRRLGAFAQTP